MDPTPTTDSRLMTGPAFADLAVRLACNVQRGQILTITAEVGMEETVRIVAEAAYRRGAAYVDVLYDDPHLARSRLRHAPDATLDVVPSWRIARVRALGSEGHAFLYLTASRDTSFFEGIDPKAIGRISQGADFAATLEVIGEQGTNWALMPVPTADWAEMVHPDLPREEALRTLAEQLAYVSRLDTLDPVAAWHERISTLRSVSERLTAQRFDRLRFTGPGTDLTVGLLPTSRFMPGYLQTRDGIWHLANVPTEEVFTAPDPLRADGVVRATKPLYLGGALIEDLEVEFASGKAVRIDGNSNVDALREAVARNANGDRLGEVALVDGAGRVGELDTILFNSVLDENAASHLALGNAYAFTVDSDDDARRNASDVHVDFMIGSDRVTVTGAPAGGGAWVPILEAGEWQL